MDSVITPPDLYNILCSSKPVLVLDVRKKSDFARERACPSIATVAHKLFSTPKDELNEKTCPITPYTHNKQFINHELYHIVVVDDGDGSAQSIVSQLKLTTRHQPTQLLAGGYKVFSALYSELCQGSKGQDQYLMDKCEKEWNKHSPIEILPYLFFGDIEVAQNYRVLDILGIGYMVNIAMYADNHAPTIYRYLRCDQEELPHGDLVPVFNTVFRFIENARKENGKVLLYSADGNDGRAGMIACAYLMRINDWSLEAAFLSFKRLSPSFSPNVAILARLGEYETSLYGSKHIEEYMLHTEEGEQERKESLKLSGELGYVRRQQVYQLEEERKEREEQDTIIAAEKEEGLC